MGATKGAIDDVIYIMTCIGKTKFAIYNHEKSYKHCITLAHKL